MPSLIEYSEAQLRAGISAMPLVAEPKSWINRRVETIELLSHEETRRRTSIDFTLTAQQQEGLTTPEGVLVPISVLTKEARRNFDLRDEANSAIPVLGRESNGELAHVAVMHAAVKAINGNVSSKAFELLSADLGQLVLAAPVNAEEALAFFAGGAEDGDQLRSAIWQDPVCRNLLETLVANYILFAVLAPGGPNRRILKYSYGDDFTRPKKGTLRERTDPSYLLERAWAPNRSYFLIECPGAWRARSFHMEIAIPEELRVESAALYDPHAEEAVSNVDDNVNRASLYPTQPLTQEIEVAALVEIVPERHGRTFQAAATSAIVTTLLWLGYASGLDTKSPGSAVSLLLAGAALFSGVTAVRGEHVLVKSLFAPSRRGLIIVGLTALLSSASLAMQIPDSHPTEIWFWSAVLCSIVAARFSWSAIRAPG